jgi:hypothetical protein
VAQHANSLITRSLRDWRPPVCARAVRSKKTRLFRDGPFLDYVITAERSHSTVTGAAGSLTHVQTAIEGEVGAGGVATFV